MPRNSAVHGAKMDENDLLLLLDSKFHIAFEFSRNMREKTPFTSGEVRMGLVCSRGIGTAGRNLCVVLRKAGS